MKRKIYLDSLICNMLCFSSLIAFFLLPYDIRGTEHLKPQYTYLLPFNPSNTRFLHESPGTYSHYVFLTFI